MKKSSIFKVFNGFAAIAILSVLTAINATGKENSAILQQEETPTPIGTIEPTPVPLTKDVFVPNIIKDGGRWLPTTVTGYLYKYTKPEACNLVRLAELWNNHIVVLDSANNPGAITGVDGFFSFTYDANLVGTMDRAIVVGNPEICSTCYDIPEDGVIHNAYVGQSYHIGIVHTDIQIKLCPGDIDVEEYLSQFDGVYIYEIVDGKLIEMPEDRIPKFLIFGR